MKKNVLRLLALVMVLVLMVPLFAACGKKKEPEVTTPAVTTPAPTPEGPAGPTGPTADSFKGAINDLVTLLTQNGAGANSTIAAQLKAELVAKLWGETTNIPTDSIDLGSIAGSMATTGLTKDLYNTLLTELVKISAANDATLTLGSNGNVTYTVPAAQLEAVLNAWSDEKAVSDYLASLAGKAEADPSYVFSKKNALDLLIWFSFSMSAGHAQGETLPMQPGVTIPDAILVYDDPIDDAEEFYTPIVAEDNNEYANRYLAAKEAYEAHMSALTPVTDANKTFEVLVSYYNTLTELEAAGYYSNFYPALPDGQTIFWHARPAVDEELSDALTVLENYLATKDIDALVSDVCDLFISQMVQVSFDESLIPENPAGDLLYDQFYNQYMEQHKECAGAFAEVLCDTVHAFANASTYEELTEVFEPLMAYETDGCTVTVAGMPLQAVQNYAAVCNALIVTLNPSEDASVEDIGIHSALANMICGRLEIDAESEDYATFEALFYDLIRAAVLGTTFDVATYADKLFVIFDVPLTVEELKSGVTALYLIAKLNDAYDFADLLATHPMLPTEEPTYLEFVKILDEELLSYLTLSEEGYKAVNADRYEALLQRLVTFAENETGMPAFLADAVSALIADLFEGDTHAFSTFVDALTAELTLSVLGEVPYEEKVAIEDITDYSISVSIDLASNAGEFTFETFKSFNYEGDEESFRLIDSFMDSFTAKPDSSPLVLLLNEESVALLVELGILTSEDVDTINAVVNGTNPTNDIFEVTIWSEYGEIYEIVTGTKPGMVPINRTELTPEELILIDTLQDQLVAALYAYETLATSTDETVEANTLALLEAYVALLESMKDISAAGYGIGSFELPPVEMLNIMIALYSYPLAESPYEGNVGLVEGLTGADIEDIYTMVAGLVMGLFVDTERLSEADFNMGLELSEQLVTALLDPTSTADAALILADLLNLVGKNYAGVNAEMWEQMISPEVPSDEEGKSILTVAMLACLAMAENVEDYNAYFTDMQLPEAVAEIDFNTFFEKIRTESTYTEALSLGEVNVEQIIPAGATAPTGAIVTLNLNVNFDIMLASLTGNVSLTFNIVY